MSNTPDGEYKSMKIKEHVFDPSMKLVLVLEHNVRYYNLPCTDLLALQVLDRDDTYLSKYDLSLGKEGWSVSGTEYFMPHELARALEAFDTRVARRGSYSGLARPGLLHDLELAAKNKTSWWIAQQLLAAPVESHVYVSDDQNTTVSYIKHCQAEYLGDNITKIQLVRQRAATQITQARTFMPFEEFSMALDRCLKLGGINGPGIVMFKDKLTARLLEIAPALTADELLDRLSPSALAKLKEL